MLPLAAGIYSHRKLTRRPGRKAPTLRPDTNTSGTAGGRVLNTITFVKNSYQSVQGMNFSTFVT